MEEFDIYSNKFSILKKINKKIYVKFIAFIIFLFTLLISLMLIQYPNIYKIDGFVSEDKIVIPIRISDLEKLEGDELKIDNKIYKYSVLSYDYLNSEIANSNDVLVTLLINQKFKNNQVVSILIEKGKTNLYKSFIKKIWKGF